MKGALDEYRAACQAYFDAGDRKEEPPEPTA